MRSVFVAQLDLGLVPAHFNTTKAPGLSSKPGELHHSGATSCVLNFKESFHTVREPKPNLGQTCWCSSSCDQSTERRELNGGIDPAAE